MIILQKNGLTVPWLIRIGVRNLEETDLFISAKNLDYCSFGHKTCLDGFLEFKFYSDFT
jgi:hypothetical protein